MAETSVDLSPLRAGDWCPACQARHIEARSSGDFDLICICGWGRRRSPTRAEAAAWINFAVEVEDQLVGGEVFLSEAYSIGDRSYADALYGAASELRTLADRLDKRAETLERQ